MYLRLFCNILATNSDLCGLRTDSKDSHLQVYSLQYSFGSRSSILDKDDVPPFFQASMRCHGLNCSDSSCHVKFGLLDDSRLNRDQRPAHFPPSSQALIPSKTLDPVISVMTVVLIV